MSSETTSSDDKLGNASKEFINGIKNSFLVIFILSEIYEKSKKNPEDLPYSQSLLDSVQKTWNIKASTCFSRIRDLRMGNFIIEKESTKNGKSVVGYSITDSGVKLLDSLLEESLDLIMECEKKRKTK